MVVLTGKKRLRDLHGLGILPCLFESVGILEYSELELAELFVLGAEERQHALQQEVAVEEGRHLVNTLHGSLFIY